ncbi:MAG: ABC transporter permease [Lachnospiraceae bacterium]|nr:ABC transporter permease [Lachnospiraceae bacterium]
MRFLDLLTMSVNNLRRRKLRTALTVLGVIIGTASIVVMISLGIGLNELNRELIESFGSLTAIEVRGEYYWGDNDGSADPNYLTDDLAADISRMDHVVSVYPLLEADAIFIQGKNSMDAQIIGAPRGYLEQITLGEGGMPDEKTQELELIYGNAVLQWFSDGKGGSAYWRTGELPDVDLMGRPVFVIFDTDAYYQSQWGNSEQPVKAPKKYMIKTAGVVEGEVNDYNEYAYSVYADQDLLKAQLRKVFRKNPIPRQPTNKKGKPFRYFIYSSMVVNVDKIEHVEGVQKQLTDMGFQASSRAEWMEQSEKQSGMIQAVLGGIGAVSLFVAAIGIANTMMMSIYERTKEIGVMKVLGCDMGAIRNMFLIESGFIGLMGGVTGVAISYGISMALNRLLRIGESLTGMAGDISRIPLWLVAMAVVFAVLVGMVAGFFPAMRAMKLSPLAAIRNE